MKDINLGSGRFIRLKNRYICDEKLSDQAVTDTIKSLVGDGAEVIVASESFGVDDMENEIFQLNNKIDELEAQIDEANDKIFELGI